MAQQLLERLRTVHFDDDRLVAVRQSVDMGIGR